MSSWATRQWRPSSQRTLLVAAVVLTAMAMAVSCAPADHGITGVGADATGAVFAKNERSLSSSDHYKSDDGGRTWVAIDYGEDRELEIVWGTHSVATPRGHYIISGTDVLRTYDGEQEVIYSADYLREPANVVLQHLYLKGADRVPSVGSDSIYYDNYSGNILVAMGVQGVLIGTPDGQWTRIAVDRYTPSDFSVRARLRLLRLLPFFWAATALLLTSFVSLAGILAICGFKEIIGSMIIAGVVIAIMQGLFLIGDGTITLAHLIIGFVILLMMITALIVLPKHSANRKSLALTVRGFVALGAGLMFPGFEASLSHLTVGFAIVGWILVAIAAGLIALAASPYRPGPLWSAAAAWAIMIPFCIIPIILWLMYLIPQEAAKTIALCMSGTIALALLGYLKRRQRGEGDTPAVRVRPTFHQGRHVPGGDQRMRSLSGRETLAAHGEPTPLSSVCISMA